MLSGWCAIWDDAFLLHVNIMTLERDEAITIDHTYWTRAVRRSGRSGRLAVVKQPGHGLVEDVLTCPTKSLEAFLAVEHGWWAKVELDC